MLCRIRDISESKGIILTALDTDETEVVVAIYAVDAEGKGTVFTKEVTVPDAELNGQVVASIEIPAGKIALRSFEATFTADANCAKMIVDRRMQVLLLKTVVSLLQRCL